MMWLNGELVERGAISASGAGALLGWGVFTTLGVRGGEPRFLARHAARLERDARAAQVPFSLDFAAISRGVAAVVESNRVQNGLARLTLLKRGDGRWNQGEGADFSVLVLESPVAPAALRVGVSPYRFDARRPLRGVKITSYLEYSWAWREAKARGFDEAILLNSGDFLCEGARSTLFWERDGAVYTPSIGTGCLVGIGRELALEWAHSEGVEVLEGEFPATEIRGAREAWLVSAAAGPRRIASWHDESGAEIRRFGEDAGFCEAFSRWFEARRE